MNRLSKRLVIYLFTKIIKIESTKNLIQYLCDLLKIDLIQLAHDANGVMKYENMTVSGEEYFLNELLALHLRKNTVEIPIIFDVGANIGQYSLLLSKLLPKAKIYSFEPNPITFKTLSKNVQQLSNVAALNIGLGSQIENKTIYSYEFDVESQHASMYKDVLLELHNAKNLIELKVEVNTLEQFCKDQNIEKIDFLKVDTEGFELEVLTGALSFLSEKKIDFIQFEFNEMNIISKVFLKDFYQILKGYKIYRLDSKKIIPLHGYNPINEIFRFHNLIAVKEGIDTSSLCQIKI